MKKQGGIKLLSVLLVVVMLLSSAPLGSLVGTDLFSVTASAATICYQNFYSATYSSDPRQYMVNIAFAQLGRSGASLGYSIEWCAAFISDCARIAGQTAAIPSETYVPNVHKNITENAGGTMIYDARDGGGGSLANARMGDIAILSRESGTNSRDHVELVYDVSGSSVYTIGGNSGTGSSCSTRTVTKHSPYNSSKIVYIVRPNYSGATHIHNYVYEHEEAHPHKDYKKCLECGYHEYLGTTTDNYVYEHEGAHPHKDYKRCLECGWFEYTGSLTNRFVYEHEEAHPHRNYIRCCECEFYEYLSTTTKVESCPECNKITVTFDPKGGTVSPSNAIVKEGNPTTLPTPTKYIYITYDANGGIGAPARQKVSVDCKGWSTNTSATSAMYSCGASYTPNSDTTLYAVWNSSISTIISSTIPTQTGYTFLGWSTNSSSTSASYKSGSAYEGSNDITFYAVWAKDECSHIVVTDSAVAATCTTAGKTQGSHCSKCGTVITTQQTIAKLGHSFGSWELITAPTLENDGVVEHCCTRCDSKESQPISRLGWSVDFNPAGGLLADTKIYYAKNNAVGTLPVPSREGYAFAGWFNNGVEFTVQSVITADITVTAQWVVNEFKMKDDSPINIDNTQKFVYGFSRENLTEEAIKEEFVNENIQVTSSNGLFGTGTKIVLYDESLGVINEATVVFFGDVNGDGWYDGMDGLLVSCLESGMLSREQVGEAVWFAADCNHDGEIDSFDIQILQQAGLILSEIDQNKSTSELLQTTAYLDYVELIDQISNVDIQESTDSPEPEQSTFSKIISFIINIFTTVIKFFENKIGG